MIDWLGEFGKKFSGNHFISHLRGLKFHGKLTINFCNGEPNTCHVEWCVKPYSSDTGK